MDDGSGLGSPLAVPDDGSISSSNAGEMNMRCPQLLVGLAARNKFDLYNGFRSELRSQRAVTELVSVETVCGVKAYEHEIHATLLCLSTQQQSLTRSDNIVMPAETLGCNSG